MAKKENVFQRNHPDGKNNAASSKNGHYSKQGAATRHSVSGQHLTYSQQGASSKALSVRRDRGLQVMPDVDTSLPLSQKSAIVRPIAFTRKLHNPAPSGQEYVDPYLFETGHFESREEYEELSRTAKIKPRSRA